MNTKTKTLASVSAIGVIAFVFHFLHIAHTVTSIEENSTSGFSNAKGTIILKHSITEKLDTMDLGEYNKKHK